MKKNVAVYVLMILAIIFTCEVNGQSGKKKPAGKSAGSSKPSGGAKSGGAKAAAKGKKPKKGKGSTTATEPTTTTTTEPKVEEPIAAEVGEPEDTGISTPDNVVAASDSFDFGSISLDTSKPTDGYYRLANLKGAKPFPFPKEDKNTVKFYKRIWREINVQDSENRMFSMPGETLVSFIMGGIKNGKLIAYDDDGFKKKLTYSKVLSRFRDSSIVTLIDTNGEMTGTKTVLNEFNPDSVTRFEIKEDIFFDKVRGRVVTQIITIGPVKSLKTTTGQYIGDSHPFYLNFEQCRKLFAAREVIDPQRDIYNISFDDVFIQRNFKSLIVKESNPADLRIRDKYPDRARQIRESNRIEREILRYKRSLWKYSS
jgi:gliding motility associated protien GldN